MWLRNLAYDNDWYKPDDDFDLAMGPPPPGLDSIDENVIAAEEYLAKTKELNAQNNIMRHYNVYQQIDKLTPGTTLTKKLETTEL